MNRSLLRSLHLRRRVAVCAAALLAMATVVVAQGPSAHAATNPCGPPVVSVIACENTLPGDPPSDWQVTPGGDTALQGFATAMSVNVGETESFKIKSSTAYHIDILRVGYYQGNGARKVASNLQPVGVQSQSACLTDSTSGLIDCGKWALSDSWTVPTTAVSGLYLAHLVRNDTGSGSVIPFVVRNDASHSDLLFQTDDETWQAYNTYGGNSLYQCTVACPPGNPGGYKAAYKVSYNRPWHTALDDNGRSWFMYGEYPMIRFLEANGYDVSYMSGLDVSTQSPTNNLLKNHKVFMSTGHDEYWSGPQRANVEAARDAGVNLAFFSGNEVFWKTRWEPSIDGTSAANRTLVTYKETHFDAPTDPQDPPTWTGTWRDPRFLPKADGGRPENRLTGQFFIVNSGTSDIQVPGTYAKLRFWRNTRVANLSSSGSTTLDAGAGTLGYEWDEDVDNGARPPSIFDLSGTTVAVPQAFNDYGTNVSAATVTHHLTLYKAPSGALVFGAGTVQWSWGLDSGNPNGNAVDTAMQQATINLFSDMGSQPFSPISGMVVTGPSTDTTAPTSTITSPSSSTSVSDGTKITITGTASDVGGTVAGVEVSTDGGNTWHPASGTTSWSYTWIAHGSPQSSLLSRAVDDSGNAETPSGGVSLNVTCPCSIVGTGVTPSAPDSGDGSGVEVGTKFTTDTFGTVSGLRFYKATKNTGTHVGNLWTASGQLLARATFTNESASGWQTVTFAQPVAVTAGTTYVVSYFAPLGHYTEDESYFYDHPAPAPDGNDSVDSSPLHAVRNSSSPNGLYGYTGTTAFPTSTYNSEFYWVDPIFTPSPAPGQVTNVSASPSNGAAAVAWTAPSTGGPATAYKVTPYAAGAAQQPTTISGTPLPTSATIPGLTNGTSYTFTVTATNPNGSGAESASSNSVTPSVAAPPVQNPGFENGGTFWTSDGVTPPVVSTAKAHSGTASALLGTVSGSEPLGDGSVSQTIVVPPSGKLSFWYWPSSTDAACSGSACLYDWFEAQIRSTSGTTLASVYKGNSNTQAWTQVSAFDMSAYAGQSVVLWFNVHQDGANPPDDTAVYLDDVAVTGSGPTTPGAPTAATATAGNATAKVSWTAPSDGGSAITSYTVTPYIGSTPQPTTTVTGNPPATSTTVTGLTNGTSYTFTVTATNAVGTGPESAKSSAVTPTAPTAPAAPTGVTASPGNGTAKVSWTAPSDGGSPITFYTITPYVGTTPQPTTTITGNPPATTTTVTGLTNGTSYTFTVTATNAVGTGPESGQSTSVTPVAAVVPAFVQAVSGHAASVTSLAVQPTQAVTVGNRLVVEVGTWSGSGATASSVTDSAGNTYTKLLSFKAGDKTEMSVWTAPVTTGGATAPTITAKSTSSADVGVVALEYSGLSSAASTGVLDVSKTAIGKTGTTAATVRSGATTATTADGELALGFYNDSGFGDALAGAASPWSTRTNMSPQNDMEMLAEDQVVGVGSTPNASAATGKSTSWGMATVVLKHG